MGTGKTCTTIGLCEKIKEENANLKKAVGNLAVDNEILKTAVDVLKKNQRLEKLKSPKNSKN